MFHTWGNNITKRLTDFKLTERISHPTVKVVCTQFGNDEATRRIALYHAKRVIGQHKGEIQKLTYK